MELKLTSVEFMKLLEEYENRVGSYSHNYRISDDCRLFYKKGNEGEKKILTPSEDVKDIFKYIVDTIDKVYYFGREDGAKDKVREIRGILNVKDIK